MSLSFERTSFNGKEFDGGEVADSSDKMPTLSMMLGGSDADAILGCSAYELNVCCYKLNSDAQSVLIHFYRHELYLFFGSYDVHSK